MAGDLAHRFAAPHRLLAEQIRPARKNHQLLPRLDQMPNSQTGASRMFMAGSARRRVLGYNASVFRRIQEKVDGPEEARAGRCFFLPDSLSFRRSPAFASAPAAAGPRAFAAGGRAGAPPTPPIVEPPPSYGPARRKEGSVVLYLDPDQFPEAPPELRQALKERGCGIPQVYDPEIFGSNPEFEQWNLVPGYFKSTAELHWAVFAPATRRRPC